MRNPPELLEGLFQKLEAVRLLFLKEKTRV